MAKPGRLAEIHTVRAEAAVEVSDGTSFRTTVVYHDPQHAVFRMEDAGRSATTEIDGTDVWTHDGTEEKEGDPFTRQFVLGHQFHAQILFYDRLYPDHAAPSQTAPAR